MRPSSLYPLPSMSRLALCLLCGAALLSPAARARTARLGAVYKGAIVTEAASGAVLFEDHADEISPPASMTKLMTFAVLDDALRTGRIQLTTPVTITPADAKVAMLRKSTNVSLWPTTQIRSWKQPGAKPCA